MIKRFMLILLVLLSGSLLPGALSAATYLLPEKGDSVIGAVSLTTSRHEDTISDLAWAYDQGYREMRYANPDVDPWLPGEGTEIVIPSRYVLPDAPRKGIVINVPEMRLYYYPRPRKGKPAEVVTYPISIGRQDWQTPYGKTSIISKIKDPSWTPPKSIKKEHAEMGDPLPDVVPAGPDNPLGLFAMRLGKRGYLIHGTNKPYGLGMRVTHGCIRLYPKDIEEIFAKVRVGTTVRIIDQPYKAGWLRGKLYLEAHPPLEEDKENYQNEYQRLVNIISKASDVEREGKIDWNSIRTISQDQTGIPSQVGIDKISGSLSSDVVSSDQTSTRDAEEVVIKPVVIKGQSEDPSSQQRSSYSELF